MQVCSQYCSRFRDKTLIVIVAFYLFHRQLTTGSVSFIGIVRIIDEVELCCAFHSSFRGVQSHVRFFRFAFCLQKVASFWNKGERHCTPRQTLRYDCRWIMFSCSISSKCCDTPAMAFASFFIVTFLKQTDITIYSTSWLLKDLRHILFFLSSGLWFLPRKISLKQATLFALREILKQATLLFALRERLTESFIFRVSSLRELRIEISLNGSSAYWDVVW